jgi:hypothetical protein
MYIRRKNFLFVPSGTWVIWVKNMGKMMGKKIILANTEIRIYPTQVKKYFPLR